MDVDGRSGFGRGSAHSPARQRMAVVLRYVGDLSVAEIGEAMGVAEGTVHRHCIVVGLGCASFWGRAMNEEDLLSRDMKALALPHDVEEGLRLVRRKVVRVRRMRTVLRVAVVIAVLALAFIGGRQAWMALRPNPVVVIVDTDIADGSAMVDGTTTAAGGLASVAQEPLEVVTHIVGAVDSVGPRLAFSVASYEWGTEAGRFGHSGGVGSGPTVFATAPDVESIAVLDTANNRVQILELGGGWRSAPTPLPEGGPYVDVAICADGNLALLAAGEVVLINLNGEVLARHAIGWDRFLPEHLSRSGADLWIVGTAERRRGRRFHAKLSLPA